MQDDEEGEKQTTMAGYNDENVNYNAAYPGCIVKRI